MTIDIAAIDSQFLTRFAFAFGFYWVWGVLSKGILEPMQQRLGSWIVVQLNRQTHRLHRQAINSCSALDDLIAASLVDVSDRLDEIVNPSEMTDGDAEGTLRARQHYREWLLKEYDLGILLKKLDKRQ
ncbi:MAG: hypothetical protein VKJ27_02165 [Synechocystis sp.]|nr:hypothetical protein [Synechocystis sp.]